MVAAYGPGRDLRAMFGALFTDPAFGTAAGSVVLSPVEWVVGSMRALSVTTDDATVRKAAAMMRSLGQVPLDPPNVSGWPSGQAWLSTASATTRVRAATTLVKAADLHAVEDVSLVKGVDYPAWRVHRFLGVETYRQLAGLDRDDAINIGNGMSGTSYLLMD